VVSSREMEFRLLGPLEVVDAGVLVALPAAKQRALLAILVLHANEVVSGERLIEDLWDARPPISARKVLQTYVSKLRRLLGSDVLVTRATGYVLCVDALDVDLGRFERLVADASRVGPRERSEKLRAALALWRGRALADFGHEPFAQPEIARLEGLRLTALEQRIDADLGTGRQADLVSELEVLVGQQPMRERLRGQLMLALYRSGRQAEALGVYRDGRRMLVEELGIEPGTALRELELAILSQDPRIGAPRELDHVPAVPAHGCSAAERSAAERSAASGGRGTWSGGIRVGAARGGGFDHRATAGAAGGAATVAPA
jgi:DNA-binding SARP family transcriptional activator